MRPRAQLTAPLVLALAASVAPLARAASPAPPLGSDGHGVRLVKRGDPARLVVLLSPKRYRAVAGKKLAMVCAPVPQATLGGQVVAKPRTSYRRIPRPPGGVVARLHPPRHRAPLATHLSPSWDWCAMTVRTFSDQGRSVDDRSFATVALTPAGAAFVNERAVAMTVFAATEFLTFSKRWVTHLHRFARLLHGVVLTAPTEAPPPGRLGLYADGRRHVYAAQTDRAGTLLFLEIDHDVVRTNFLRYLQDDSLLWGVRLFG